jgi:hypothetical protein
MNALISFHKSSDVPDHNVDIDIVPQKGDFFDLPDVSNQYLYPVERVIFRLTRTAPGAEKFEIPQQGVGVYISLGEPQNKTQ